MKTKKLSSVRSREEILSDICSIESAVSGKITVKRRPLKNGGVASYYQLQQWREGRNVTTHIPTSKLEQFRESVAGHEKVTSLVSELSRADTRRLCEDEADPVKKNCKKDGEDGGEIKKTTLPPATIIVLIMLRDKV